ncbi:TPA: rRNA (guanine-N1)-methyltransferase, partial [Streptococcus suis]
PISLEHAQVLADMTPLFFQVDQSKLDLSQLTEITIEGLLLIGTI